MKGSPQRRGRWRTRRDPLPQGDVARDAATEEEHVLEDRRDPPAEIPLRQIPHVDAVDANRAPIDVVESREQLDDRRLAGAGRPDESHLVADVDREAHVPEDPVDLLLGHRVRILIAEPDALELDEPALRGGALGRGLHEVGDAGFGVEHLKDPLRTRHGRLHDRVLCRQVPQRHEEALHVVDEDVHDPARSRRR